MSMYFGIDFGTSTNYITKWDEVQQKAVPVVGLNGYGSSKNSFPNVIYYQPSGQPIIGNEAYEKYRLDPDNGVYAIKRHIGEDAWTCEIPNIGKKLTANEVVKDIFTCIKNRLEKMYGGKDIDGVVISVPYSYQSRERNLIRRSAESAGMRVIGLIEEPVAAALSYGLFNTSLEVGASEKVLIFDLGGGTFDVTIFNFIRSSDGFRIEVLNTSGNKYLGGNDIDELLKNYFIDKILGIPLEGRVPKYQSGILKIAKDYKESLSELEKDEVFETEAYGNLDLECEVSREMLEDLLGNGFIAKVEECLDEAIYDVEGLEPVSIDKVVLVGGSSNIPVMRKTLLDFFGKEPLHTGKPEELVGEGAGIFCGMKLGKNGPQLDVVQKISYSIGVRVGMSFESLLSKNSCYKQLSEIKYLSLANSGDTETEISVYQGNSKNIQKCCQVGVIPLKPTAFPDGKIGIKLGTDGNGTIVYQLFDKNGKNIAQGKF